jgi:hypothetical protein
MRRSWCQAASLRDPHYCQSRNSSLPEPQLLNPPCRMISQPRQHIRSEACGSTSLSLAVIGANLLYHL